MGAAFRRLALQSFCKQVGQVGQTILQIRLLPAMRASCRYCNLMHWINNLTLLIKVFLNQNLIYQICRVFANKSAGETTSSRARFAKPNLQQFLQTSLQIKLFPVVQNSCRHCNLKFLLNKKNVSKGGFSKPFLQGFCRYHQPDQFADPTASCRYYARGHQSH